MENNSRDFEVRETLEKLKSTLLFIENQLVGYIGNPDQITSENSFDFTVIEIALKRIEVLDQYFVTGNFNKEIRIKTY